MTARVEMLLYHGLAATGRVEISTTSASGPWTECWLSSTVGVIDALAAWEAAANAALPARTWSFYYELVDSETPKVWVEASGGDAWVKLSPCLADLLGFSSVVLTAHAVAGSDQPVLAVLENDVGRLGIGTTWPNAVEESELYEYRGGRATTYHHGRALEMDLDLYVPPLDFEEREDSPLTTGHAAVRVELDDVADWHPDTAPGGVLYLYPLSTTVEHPVSEEHVWLRVRCSMGDL